METWSNKLWVEYMFDQKKQQDVIFGVLTEQSVGVFM